MAELQAPGLGRKRKHSLEGTVGCNQFELGQGFEEVLTKQQMKLHTTGHANNSLKTRTR